MAAGDLASIKDPGVGNKMGGLQQRIFLAEYGTFQTLQEPAANTYNIATPHTFASGGGFIELYVIQDTGMLKIDPMGGPDRNSFKATGEFHHPGESDEIINFMNKAKSGRFVLLAPLPGSAELIQIGNKEFQARIAPSYDTGKNSGDGRTSMFKFECFMADIIKYKAASIPMKGATV